MKRDDIVARDKRFVWHPYTQMKRYVEETDPFVIERAQGSILTDVDGKRYIDGNSSWWVASLGHNHPRLVRALTNQAQKLCHVSLAGVTHEPIATLGERLIAVAPKGIERAFFSDDGSTALEAAIKMAVGYHQHRGDSDRTDFVSLCDAFHGETLGVTALGGVELFRKSFASLLMNVHFAPPPKAHEDETGPAAQALDALLAKHGRQIAGMVLEPLVQGATGMRFYPAWYLRFAKERCAARGVLLIIDEVFTGYGRTGTFWASEQASVTPDILCTAKAFSGGMFPMAATLVTDAVYEAFLGPPEKAFYYGHSFAGNPLGARVALEVLDVMRDEKIVEGVEPRRALIAKTFSRLGSHPGVLEPRTLGMIGALDLSAGGSYLGQAGWRVFQEARRRGAYLRPLGDVVYVAPPLNIPLAELEELLAIVEASVAVALQ